MTAPSAGKRSLNKGSAHQNQAQEGSCPCVFQIKELQVVPRLGKEGNPPKQSRLSTESRELTCCLRWVSCCFISSHILCDSTASFSSWERAKHYLGMLSAQPCTAEARGAQQGSSLAPEDAQGAAKIWDNAQGCAVRGKKQKVQPPEKCLQDLQSPSPAGASPPPPSASPGPAAVWHPPAAAAAPCA